MQAHREEEVAGVEIDEGEHEAEDELRDEQPLRDVRIVIFTDRPSESPAHELVSSISVAPIP